MPHYRPVSSDSDTSMAPEAQRFLDATRSFRALLTALLILARSTIRQHFRNAIHASIVPHGAGLRGGSNRKSRAAFLSLSFE